MTPVIDSNKCYSFISVREGKELQRTAEILIKIPLRHGLRIQYFDDEIIFVTTCVLCVMKYLIALRNKEQLLYLPSKFY